LADQVYFFRHDGPPATMPARLAEALRDWANQFYAQPNTLLVLPKRRESAPALVAYERNGRLQVRDTRRCASAGHYELTALESAICRALDTARSATALDEALRHEGCEASSDEIAAAVQRLSDWKLVLQISGKLLFLATDENPVPYATFDQFAGGLALLNPLSPEAAAAEVEDVWQKPILDMFEIEAVTPASPT
jgi:magnesium-protoporphyrin IX monomethyl ester (oxidative) cyclase